MRCSMPQLETLDASRGDILINDGRGRFKWVEPGQTGLELTGQVRDIEEINIGEKKFLLCLQNDEFPLLYQLGTPAKSK